jgi:hypothetical protein
LVLDIMMAGGERGIPAKVRPKLEGLFDRQVGKVLVAEGDHLALRHEPRQLVLARCAERGELDALDLGADGRGEMGHRDGALGQEVGIRRVGVLAVFVVLEGLERGILFVAVPGWEVVRVLKGYRGQ